MNKSVFIWLIVIFAVSCSGNHSEKKEQPVPIEETPSSAEAPEALEDNLDPEIEDVERTEWQNPDLILDLIGNLENKVVADIGAGSGYFTFKLARTAQKVIALDIDPKALEYINKQKSIVGDWSDNIEARLTPPDVPNLLSNEADIILIVNTYNYIPNKDAYFPRLLDGLKPGGQLFIVDFKKGEIPVGPSDKDKVDPQQIRAALRKASFRKVSIDQNSLEYQYIITAQKK